MSGGTMSWRIEYYQKENESVPVEDFLMDLEPKLRAKAFLEIELLEEHGLTLKEPYVKPMKGKPYKGIYELRVRFSSNIARIFYFVYVGRRIVLLSGFTKKSNATPKVELDRALAYKDDFERRSK